MKRYFFIAAMAILAVGCQKTEIQNEVQTPIGFSTEVGKQTRAIVDGAEYGTTQPFGVYAFGHQGTAEATTIMDNVEIFTVEGEWRATNGVKYYWPNDPTTSINFYAYSPILKANSNQKDQDDVVKLKNHQVMNGTFSHGDEAGLSITGYTHSNMYVDFMVADNVVGAKYNDASTNTTGKVNLTFNHRMAQLVFKVLTNEEYDDITFRLKSITLTGIKNTANITNGVFTNDASGAASFVIFPAKAETDVNGAPALQADQTTLVIDHTANEDSEIIPVTMIPQAFDQNQSFEVVYDIAGTGVAKETVTKVFKFENTPAWDANKKITYTLTIGLNEITFNPSVATWTEGAGAYYNPDNIDPNYNTSGGDNSGNN